MMASVPASAAITVTFARMTAATGGHFDIKTGEVPATVRMQGFKGWDSPTIPGIREVAEAFCFTPAELAVLNQQISFTVMRLSDFVANGNLTVAQGNLYAGFARAGSTGLISNAFASAMLYQAAGGPINFGHVPTADFFNQVNAAIALIPTHFYSMNGVGVLVDGNPSSQDFVFVGRVPEPSTWAMLVIGFGLIGATARRRSSYQSVSA